MTVTKKVLEAYQKSWVGFYYGYEGKLNEHKDCVVFFNPKTKNHVRSVSRFAVYFSTDDDNTKLYLAPKSFWSTLQELNQIDTYYVETLSNIPHGMSVVGHPYTKSPFYKAPYFVTFKTNHSVQANYLVFNDFVVPNSFGLILGVLNYDDNLDKFVITFKSDILLPFNNSSSLTSVLEFAIVDANQKIVQFKDESQIFISLEVL
jgi:hypothetical protein